MKENGGLVLITGGLGYLGGRIARHLLSLGFRVRIASSQSSPSVPGELSECEVFSYNFAEENTLSKVCKDLINLLSTEIFLFFSKLMKVSFLLK